MAEKEITSKLSIDQDIWDELVEFIKDRKDSRKDSDKFYAERAIEGLAYAYLQDKRSEEQELMDNYADLKQELEEAINE